MKRGAFFRLPPPPPITASRFPIFAVAYIFRKRVAPLLLHLDARVFCYYSRGLKGIFFSSLLMERASGEESGGPRRETRVCVYNLGTYTLLSDVVVEC